MADESVIIDIQVSDSEAIKAITEAQQRVEELTAAKKAAEEQDGKNSESVARLTAQIKVENDIIRANQKILVDNIKTQKANDDSLNAMRATLRNLTKQYDDLSKAEREGAKGKELLEKIKEVNARVSEAEQATGRFQRNVGNYPKVFDIAGTTMGKFATLANGITGGAKTMSAGFANAGKAVADFGKQLLSLLANPIVAIIAAIAAVVMQVVNAFKKNDEASTRLKAGLSALKPIISAVKAVFSALATVVGKVVEVIGKAVRAIASLIPGYKEAADAALDLVNATDRLEDTERAYTVAHARRDAQISELRNKANDAEQYSFQQREEFLNQAIALEKEDLKARLVISKEKLRLARLEAQMNSDTSDETKNKLAELEAAVYAAEKDYNDGIRRLSKSAQEFRKQERERRNAAAKQAESDRKERAKKEVAEQRALEDALIAAMKDGADKAKAEARTAAERQIADLKQRLTEEKNLTEKARKAISERIILIEAQMHLQLAKIDKEANAERLSKNLQAAVDYWTARLALVKKGSEEERAARVSQLNAQTTEEVREIERRFTAREITEQQYETLIAAAHKKMRDEIAAYDKEQANEAARIAQVEWENKINATIEGSEERFRLELAMRKEQLDALHQMEGESDADFKARQLAAQKAYTDASKALDAQQVASQVAKAEAVASVTGSISKLMESAAGENEALAAASKVLALAQVAISQGVAIAKGVAASQDVPFPGNLAAMASVVGAIVTVITSAIDTINSAKFASGGYVRGAGTGTSDSIPARLSNGESVINAKSTAKYFGLLSAINQDGGGVPFSGALRRTFATGGYVNTGSLLAGTRAEEVAQMMRDAVADMHPVVSVREIARVQGRVEAKERIVKNL